MQITRIKSDDRNLLLLIGDTMFSISAFIIQVFPRLTKDSAFLSFLLIFLIIASSIFYSVVHEVPSFVKYLVKPTSKTWIFDLFWVLHLVDIFVWVILFAKFLIFGEFVSLSISSLHVISSIFICFFALRTLANFTENRNNKKKLAGLI